MKPKVLSILKYLLLLAVAIGLLLFAFRGIRINKVFSDMLKANIFWVLVSAAFSILAIVSRAYRWTLLIESAGYSSPLRKTLYAVMIGYFANLAFPRLGEVTRCGSLSKAENIPFTSLLGTVIVERVVDLLSLLACLLLAAVIEYRRLGNFLHENIIKPIMDKLMLLVASPVFIGFAFLLLIIIIVAVSRYWRRAKEKQKRSKFVQLWNQLIDGLRSIAKLKRPWLFIFHSVLIWVLYFFGMYTCFFALAPTAQLGLGAALFLLVAGGLGMSAPVQGGIGAYHLLVSQGLMLYGLTREDGLTFATLIHTLQLILIVLFGIPSMLLLFSKSKRVPAAVSN
jgi:glycosyltransferase 2 family protein